MSIWMIHEVTKEDVEVLRSLPTSDLLIWDDAVISQIYGITALPNHKHILAVSTNVANYATNQKDLYVRVKYEPTSISHKRWHEEGIASAFMTWDEIKELSYLPNVSVAAHGYNHTRPIKDLRVGVKHFLEDCSKIECDFLNMLSKKPEIYVYPYNDAPYWTDALLHKKYGWTTYGKGRLDAKKLFAGEIL